MYGINTLPQYYSYSNGGYVPRQPYGLGGFLKNITKPVSKVLDKIVPNEIKPALPFITALAPLTGVFGSLASSMPAFGLTGDAAGVLQRMLLGGGLNTISQLSQEGAERRGLNPLSTIGSLVTAGLSGPTAGTFLESFRPQFGDMDLTAPGFLDTAKSSIIDAARSASQFLNEGREAPLFSKTFAKTAAIPVIEAGTETAYNVAENALNKYNTEQTALGQMGAADQSKRRDAVIHAMQLSGFGETDITSALGRLGLADGGIGYQYGGGAIGYKQGGLMDLKGHEMDFRDGGGFVPLGRKEKADDVPARLSKNEFVFTAKAVRNAGDGDIKKGAKKMYQIMKQLEARA